MPRTPEHPPEIERVAMPFLMSSRFESKEASQGPYDTLQTILHERVDLEFSAFRLLQNWPESLSKAPPSTKRWYVVAIGDTPPEPVFAQVAEAINQGELAPIPDEAVAELYQR